MIRRLMALMAVLFLFTPVSKAFSVDLIINGSFENPNINEFWTTRQPAVGTILSPSQGLWVQFQSGNTEMPGWTVTQGNVDLVRTEWTSFAGSQSVDLVGRALGGLQQTFTTTPGSMYRLSFEYANNWFNGGGTASVELIGQGSIFTDTVSHFNSTNSNMNWVNYGTNFIANSNSTTLRFTALTSSGDGGVVIDNVSVVQPVPEPSSFVLLGIAILAAGCGKRFSRFCKI